MGHERRGEDRIPVHPGDRAGPWEVLCRPAKRVREGDTVLFPGRRSRPRWPGSPRRAGASSTSGRPTSAPFSTKPATLPCRPTSRGPGRTRRTRPEDIDRYQTVFAKKEGAIAAPTAGLHFTEGRAAGARDRGVDVRRVTLDVGLATFQPVRAELVADHRMLEETYAVTPAAAKADQRRQVGRPARSRPSARRSSARSRAPGRTARSAPAGGATSLFITPGFEFRVVDRLLTNFHLPQSTLLMLVSAFAGYDLVMAAYREAVRERYRFFSYGDAMLIL
ncbi:MAG: S-adenosylmethionine:tRNA ribosyltransferase-isomerase [Candidatus Moduliflexus flocculans]|nr:S-adenosylmethionine:tRNA ribosyltransferase-isomerase [Candidatus Moduliflexus flocculans]